VAVAMAVATQPPQSLFRAMKCVVRGWSTRMCKDCSFGVCNFGRWARSIAAACAAPD
jgi:hypothetical protein